MYACNREHPADTALNYFGNRISFGELFAQIDRAARAFLALGVRPGDVVPIVSVSTVASVVCFYALNRIGAVVDFLNVLAERDDLVKYLREAEARVVVTLDLCGEKVLDGHEAVLQSCIVGAVSGTDQVLRAYVAVAKTDMARTPEIERDLRERCEQSLPSYARPTFYTFREALPLTPAGKVDYRALETEAQNA